MSEAIMANLDYSHAPLPHALAADMALSHGACRTWGIVHMLKWNHIDPDPPTLAEVLGVDKRSVFRWLQELERAGWLTWNRHATDPRKRLLLKNGKDGADAARLAAIRALFSNGAEPSIEAIKGLLEAPEAPEDGGGEFPEDGDDGGGPGGQGVAQKVLERLRQSDSGVTNDSSVTNDSGVTCDSGVACDPRITWSDTGVTACDTGITCGDSRVTPCDTGVILGSDSSLPNGMNRITREVGVGGLLGKSADLPIEAPTPRKAGRPKRHRAHATRPKTALENWLLDNDMMPASARRFAHLDMAAAQASFREFMRDCQPEDRLRRIGALVERWKERPPQPPQPVRRPAQQLDMDAARALARQLAPDADDLNLNILAADLAGGKPQAEAMDAHRQRLAFDQHWQGKAVPR